MYYSVNVFAHFSTGILEGFFRLCKSSLYKKVVNLLSYVGNIFFNLSFMFLFFNVF